jgi:predicted phosphodiesterase
MAALERPLVIVSDVHLSHAGTREKGDALAALVRQHTDAEIILNGDIFNLSLDPPGADPQRSMLDMLEPETELREALRAHVTAGRKLSFLPGNHDASLADPRTREALLSWLGLGQNAPLEVGAWFLRRGNVHVEHGHAYDPDNAPTHPLCVPSPRSEPLGVALTRRFLAPHRAFDFAHATEITPLEALLRALRVFGTRTPVLLAHYFATAGTFCREAGWSPALAAEFSTGDARVDAFAKAAGVEAARIRALIDDRPRPTHESFERAFFRLYFDRVVSASAIGAGLGGWVLARTGTPLGIAAAGALYLAESQRRGRNRYEGLPVKRLRAAAGRVREFMRAELVVFGHTHVAETEPGYMNPGSFTYRAGPGRPYALIDRNGQASILRAG